MAMSRTCSSSCKFSFFSPTWNFMRGSISSRVCPAVRENSQDEAEIPTLPETTPGHCPFPPLCCHHSPFMCLVKLPRVQSQDRGRVWELEEVQVESHHTFGDISDVILVVLAATVPGHVIHGERLVGTQHDHFNGTRLKQDNLVIGGEIPVGEGRPGEVR